MEECVVCNSKFKKINDYVYKCNNCSLFKSKLKPGHGRDIEGISELRRKNFKKIIEIILSLNVNQSLKILEIGSGNGFFIEECKKSNIDITGSEADQEQYNLLKKKFSNIIKINLPIKDLNNELLNKFDIVVFNDVFEHLVNLDLILIQLKSILKTNGQIVINLPSSDGLIYKLSNILNKIGFTNFYDRLWQKNLASPHLSYFNNLNLKMLFKKHGYNLIHTSSLDTVSKKGNFIRLNSTIKYKFICFLLSGLLFLFYYFQKILPKDIILHIYKRP
ncbi:class I SAM-dependent methyltransferase [Candidatus Pelagibacter bacterium]|mgnify:CR=1 FL=1|nr:class I SAM-dependent methyltransferase [Candidatus Pelagibacter bacterium]